MSPLPKANPRVVAVVRVAFIAAAVGLLLYALVSQWGSIHRALGRMGPLAVIGSLGAALVGLFLSALCFRSLLIELGSRLPLLAALRVFFLAQVGKYLPGSVWPLLAQVELSRDLGVPRQRSATAGLLFLGLNPLTGLIVAGATLPLVSPDAARHYLWALAIVPVGLAILHPKVLNPALRQAFRLIRRPPLERPLRAAGLARSAGWLFVMWLFYGLSVLALAAPLGIRGGQSFLICTGAYALAWSAGFIVVIAPAGLGVRDAALVLTLSPVMSVSAATAVAAVSRVVQTVGDGLWAAAAGGLHARAKLAREQSDPAPDQDADRSPR